MEKTIRIGNADVKFKATALTPRLYRAKVGRDMISDLMQLQDALKTGKTAFLSPRSTWKFSKMLPTSWQNKPTPQFPLQPKNGSTHLRYSASTTFFHSFWNFGEKIQK